MRVLVIDSYDSFTFNLCQQIGVLGAEPVVVKSDTPFERLRSGSFGRIVLSPGPGHPRDSALYREVLGTISRTVPTLGVCLVATRYHSLVIDPASVPDCLAVTATSDDGAIMGVRHRSFPIEGVQFHPESILTPEGNRLVANFLSGTGGAG